MTTLFACQLLCFALMPLFLITGQGLFIPALTVLVVLIRRQMVLQQQVEYLLQQDSLMQMRKVISKPDAGLKQVDRVKGL